MLSAQVPDPAPPTTTASRVLFDDGGRLRPVTNLAHEHAAVIASIDLVTRKGGGGDVDYVHRTRLRDKVRALEGAHSHPASAVMVGGSSLSTAASTPRSARLRRARR